MPIVESLEDVQALPNDLLGVGELDSGHQCGRNHLFEPLGFVLEVDEDL